MDELHIGDMKFDADGDLVVYVGDDTWQTVGDPVLRPAPFSLKEVHQASWDPAFRVEDEPWYAEDVADLVCVLDAENRVICKAPRETADLIARILEYAEPVAHFHWRLEGRPELY